MRKIILSLVLSFVAIHLFFGAHSTAPRLFMMLNVDNTVVDRIDPADTALIQQLTKQGYVVQRLEFNTNQQWSPKFITLYWTLARGEKSEKESEYMSRIKVQQVSEDAFHITEYIAIRPGLKKFLEEIEDIGIPVYILVCSRNDDIRTEHLVENLDLSIKGRKFGDVAEFVPREYFRVKIALHPDQEPVIAKSAVKLREYYTGRYGPIRKDDYVILIDKLEDARFIVSDPQHDLNVRVDEFFASPSFNQLADRQHLQEAVLKIKKFVGR